VMDRNLPKFMNQPPLNQVFQPQSILIELIDSLDSNLRVEFKFILKRMNCSMLFLEVIFPL